MVQTEPAGRRTLKQERQILQAAARGFRRHGLQGAGRGARQIGRDFAEHLVRGLLEPGVPFRVPEIEPPAEDAKLDGVLAAWQEP